jgi:hypothetical protein
MFEKILELKQDEGCFFNNSSLSSTIKAQELQSPAQLTGLILTWSKNPNTCWRISHTEAIKI